MTENYHPDMIIKDDIIASKDEVYIRKCTKCHRDIPTNKLNEPYICCDCEEIEISDEKFKQMVQQKMKEKSISFVLAVYQIYDEKHAEEIKNLEVKLACTTACSYCCYQLITCTEMEMEEIKRYVENLPKRVRRPIVVRLKKSAKKRLKYYQKNQHLLEADMLKPQRDWYGKPCPFLDETRGICAVYPVRTIDCRTMYSYMPCKTKKYFGTERVRFPFKSDKIANNLIMDKQKESGSLAVTPVPHWLNMKWNFNGS